MTKAKPVRIRYRGLGPNTKFGAMLRLIRDQAGQPLKVVAYAMGLSTSYLNDLERGCHPPPKEHYLLNFADFMEVDPQPLLQAAARYYYPSLIVNAIASAGSQNPTGELPASST